jgi:hypothetical protein
METLLRKYDLLKRGVEIQLRYGTGISYMVTRLCQEVQDLAIEHNDWQIYDYTVLVQRSYNWRA